MSSHCTVSNGKVGSQFGQEQVQDLTRVHDAEDKRKHTRGSHEPNSTSTYLVPMPNYEFTELTWENGQLAMHGLGDLLRQPPPTAVETEAKPLWVNRLGSPETLESIVYRGTKARGNTGANGILTGVLGGLVGGANKRARLDYCGVQDEDACVLARAQARSTCGNGSATFDSRDNNDTTMMTWPASEDKDSKTSEETRGEDEDGKRSGRARSRRSRSATIHNESEKRRRDRINQRMRTLQKLVPNASKADKVSILDDVIDYMKQLQAQIQLMSFRTNLQTPPTHLAPAAPSPPMGMHHIHNHHIQMSLIAAAAAQMGAGGGFIPPGQFVVQPQTLVAATAQANRESNNINASIPPLPDPYAAFLEQQRASMELYNKMAAALYKTTFKSDYTANKQ